MRQSMSTVTEHAKKIKLEAQAFVELVSFIENPVEEKIFVLRYMSYKICTHNISQTL